MVVCEPQLELRCNDTEDHAFVIQVVQNLKIMDIAQDIARRNQPTKQAATERVIQSFRQDDTVGHPSLQLRLSALTPALPQFTAGIRRRRRRRGHGSVDTIESQLPTRPHSYHHSCPRKVTHSFRPRTACGAEM